MSQAFITQCPNCGTAFEVSERELSMAEGIVRCGQCRHVFTATDFPVAAGSSAASDAELPDFARHADDDSADPSQNLHFSFRDAAPPPSDELPDDDALFDDTTGVEEAQAQQIASRQMQFSEDFLSAGSSTDAFADESRAEIDPFLAAAEDPALATAADAEYAELGPLILDDDADDTPAAEPDHALTDIDDTAEYPRIDSRLLDDGDLDSAFADLDDEPLTATPADAGTRAPLHSKLQRLAASPVEMPIHDTRSRLRREWPWLALSALALLGLLVQYTSYRFDTLAHDTRFRGSLALACRLVGCSLPPEQDLQRLQTSNLVIRSHPELQSVLMADFILSNEAGFDQSLPALLLQFSDRDGLPLAQRLLQPADYMAGEMAGSRRLPARQSVHVSLALIDPGPAAIGYALQVMPGH